MTNCKHVDLTRVEKEIEKAGKEAEVRGHRWQGGTCLSGSKVDWENPVLSR